MTRRRRFSADFARLVAILGEPLNDEVRISRVSKPSRAEEQAAMLRARNRKIEPETEEQRQADLARAEQTERVARQAAEQRARSGYAGMLARLKAAMVASHPDKGGSSSEFIAARKRFVEARDRHRRRK